MTVTQTQVCNLALDLLKEAPLGASDLSDDTKAVPRWFNRNWSFARDAVLAAYPWNFAITRAVVEATTQAITGITRANPAVVTYSGADNFANGNVVLIDDVVGMTQVNGQRYTVANLNTGANTFELSDTNSSAYTAYSSGGTLQIVPAFGWLFRYPVPSDSLRILPLEEEGDFEGAPVLYEVEKGYILTDQSTSINIRYIAQITDPTSWSPVFIQAFAAYLAAAIAPWLTGKTSAWQAAQEVYRARMAEARQIDAMEGVAERPYVDDVIAARYV